MQERRPTTFDVRVWGIRKVTGKRGTRHMVRWSVGGRQRAKTFATRALANSHRADLMSAMNRGEPFDLATGLPMSMLPDERSVTWWEWTQRYVDLKWASLAPTSRRSIAIALSTATMALLSGDRGKPPAKQLRAAMVGWAYVAPRRAEGPPPDRLARAVDWLSRNTVDLADLEDPGRARAVLDALTRSVDGTPAAATTVARKRAVLSNCLELAVEQGLLQANPLSRLRWRAPRVNEVVDPATVVNPDQARALLDAVARVTPTDPQPGEGMGRRDRAVPGRRRPLRSHGAPLVAFFGCLYYAALRPSEAQALRLQDLQLPATDDEWGWLRLAAGDPTISTVWTDTGRRARQLKHRPVGAVRIIPCVPELVALLRCHLDTYGAAADGRLFRGPRGGAIRDEDYQAVWQAARRLVLPDADTSPLARRPYDLRHACVSTWLAGGVESAQVAHWAGHSVAVLHRVYAHVLHGREDVARRRIEQILRNGAAIDREDRPASTPMHDG